MGIFSNGSIRINADVLLDIKLKHYEIYFSLILLLKVRTKKIVGAHTATLVRI